jgi:tetratricopeptide (TPR) repeat protein
MKKETQARHEQAEQVLAPAADAPEPREMVEAVAESAREVMQRARDLGQAERWAEAAALLLPLAEALPGAVELWLQAAQWQQAAGDSVAAHATLRHAIAVNAGRHAISFALWHALARHLFEAQDWAGATNACQAALALAPRRAAKSLFDSDVSPGESGAGRLREHELLEMLATTLAHQGQFEAAVEAMRALLALSPRDPLHRMRLASLLQTGGALGEAAREFERVGELAPGTFFAQDAESSLEVLDRAQIQQILLRAGEEGDFGLRLERDMEETLWNHAFHLSESGRESLRQIIDDGRPDLSRAPRLH